MEEVSRGEPRDNLRLFPSVRSSKRKDGRGARAMGSEKHRNYRGRSVSIGRNPDANHSTARSYFLRYLHSFDRLKVILDSNVLRYVKSLQR